MKSPLDYVEAVEVGNRRRPAFYMAVTVVSGFLAAISFLIDQDVVGILLLAVALTGLFLFLFFWAWAGQPVRPIDSPVSDKVLASKLERSGFEKDNN